LKWIFGKRVNLKLDGAHPKLSAHHMKLLVIDDSVAFCGGIDMTVGRWDTPRHLENDPARRSPWGKRMRPWHEATTCLTGPAARSLAELAQDRWLAATGETVQPVTSDTDLWPGNIKVDFTDVTVGIARTAPRFGLREQIVEIETATLAIILSAKHSLYIESQYFASRRIAEALAQRLREKDGPEIVMISPLGAGGWLESKFMDSARVRMMKLIRDADAYGRFRIYYPVNDAGTPIYVHAKFMVADDMILKIGSANLNNRSMGFDTECDIIVEAQEDDVVTSKAISARRNALLAEHLGQTVKTVSSVLHRSDGSLIKTIDDLNTNPRGLRPIPLRELMPDEELLAEASIADPERPAGVKYRTSAWLRKRFGRQVP
jgi:phospholipase D1/2